ncbi:hypothetical protein GCM10027317_48940 [Massilia agri]
MVYLLQIEKTYPQASDALIAVAMEKSLETSPLQVGAATNVRRRIASPVLMPPVFGARVRQRTEEVMGQA